jgi:hypothetical protein
MWSIQRTLRLYLGTGYLDVRTQIIGQSVKYRCTAHYLKIVTDRAVCLSAKVLRQKTTVTLVIKHLV